MSLAAGLLLALGSAFALNWGWIAQHGAASRLPSLSLCRPLASLRILFSNLSWVSGFLVGIAGWGLYVAALSFAPLSLVQAVSAGGIGILAALAGQRGEILTRAQWAAIAVSTAGLLLLGVSLAGDAAGTVAPRVAVISAWLVVSAAIAALAGLRGLRLAVGAPLGIAAGVLYAAGDIATKAATFAGPWLALVAVVLVSHGAAFVALQLGFQRGGALATAGTATLLTNALPIAAGLALFHEHVPGGAPGVLRILAFAFVVIGAAALARLESGPSRRRTEEPKAAVGGRIHPSVSHGGAAS